MEQGSNHTSDSEEQDPNGGPWTMDCDEVARRYDALTYFELTKVLDRQILPSDDRERQTFDIMTQFELGDPHTHYHAPSATGYETSGECGCPDWPALFLYVLDHCRGLEHADTVYILVDNRNLTDQTTTEGHWPTVAAWWKSRMLLTGPAQEQCDLAFFPISAASGLKNIHPTWAGTFVLAALCLFPKKHLILIDHDCIPVTLFEVRDLWREAHLARVQGMPCGRSGVCTGDPSQDPPIADCGNVPEPEQGVLLATEHNAEINAGFSVVFGSNHAPVITKDDWWSLPVAPGKARNQIIGQLRDKVVEAYWQIVRKMVGHGRNERHMTREECQAWVQTGLGLTPFCGYSMDSSLEWTIPHSTCPMIRHRPPCTRGLRLALNRAHYPLS